MMIEFDPIKALSYGAIGLGMILAYLSYRLLSKEQARESEPRQVMLRSIYIFMIFSVVLTAAGIVSEHLKGKFETKKENQRTTLGPLSPTSISKNNLEQYLYNVELSWPVTYFGDGVKYQHFHSQGLLVYAEFPDGLNQGDLKSCIGERDIILNGHLAVSPSDRYFLLSDAYLSTADGLLIQCSRPPEAPFL